MKYFQAALLFSFGIAVALHGCDSDPFPVGESFNEGFQVPFVTTHTFNFQTGSKEVSGVEGQFKIISEADVQNLLAASPDVREQSNEKGIISGVVVDPSGAPVQNVSIGGTDTSGKILRGADGAIAAGIKDAAGNIVAPLLYNSINGIPQFINTFGTADSGGFTALNVPPGEHFISAVQGGRGNGRVTTFAGGLSLVNIDIIPVKLPVVRVTGIVADRANNASVEQARIAIPGLAGTLISGQGGGFTGSGFGSDSLFSIRVEAAGHLDTYQDLSTDLSLLQPGVISPDITQNLTVVSLQDVQTLASDAGAAVLPNTGIVLGKVIEGFTRKSEAVVVATDQAGNQVGDVFYFNTATPPRPACNLQGQAGCLTKTSSDGSFLILNIPIASLEGNNVFLKAHAVVDASGTGGQTRSSGGKIVSVFSNAVSMTEIGTALIQGEDAGNTIAMSGFVRNNKGTAIGNTTIRPLGVSTPPSFSLPDGSYNISKGANTGDTAPLLANSVQLFKLEESGSHVPTYQFVGTGSQDLVRDLTILPSGFGSAAGKGAIFGRVLNRLRVGRVDGVEILATQMIQGKVSVETGTSVGDIVYFDEAGVESASLTATSASGQFLIRNLPPGLVMLKALSSDDSGNAIIQTFADGVTLAGIAVNHVPLTVPVKGTFQNLHNEPQTGATLSILGEQGGFSSDALAGGIPFPAKGSFIVKAQGSGLIDTFNYQIETELLERAGEALFITTRTELEGLAAQGGLSLDLGKGVVAGTALEQQIVEVATKSTASAPQALATGFFNTDNLPDLAVANSQGQIEIFLRKKDTSFEFDAPTTPITVGTDPRSIGVGDFDGNGTADLAVANFGSNNLTILSGNGDGTFPGTRDIALGADISPVFVSVSDLNQDGKLDLATANEVTGNGGSDGVIVLLGDGSGGFSASGLPCPSSSPCPVSDLPRAIASGEFDGDEILDLAIASAGSSTLSLLLSGASTPANALIAGEKPGAIATGDINGDGNLDLVAANSGSAPVSASVSSFLGDGAGGFTKVDCDTNTTDVENCLLESGNSPKSIALIHFDDDGRLDLAVTSEAAGTTAKLSVIFGDGNGRFSIANALSSSTSQNGPTDLVSADFNQDGLRDFAFGNNGSSTFSLIFSQVNPAQGVAVEARSPEGDRIGTARYLLDDGTFHVDPGLTETRSNGRFMLFDLPLGLTTVKAVRGSSPAVIGNTLVNISQAGSLSFTKIKVAQGLPGSVVVDGLSCRPVGITCSRVGNVAVSFLGTTNQESCRSDPDCVSNRLNGDFIATLAPHSSYVVKLEGPDVTRPGDTDGDGITDLQDNCPNVPNPNQVDENGNRIGDACELQISDDDGDGIPNEIDNCRLTFNPDQRDDDQDGVGNACDQPVG